MSDVDVLDPDDEDPEDEQDQEETHALGQVPLVPTPANRMNRIKSRELAQQLWEEYSSGLNQKQLAELHGTTPQAVNYHMRRYARHYGRKEIDRARRLDLDRVESIIDAIWKHAIEGNPQKIKLLLMMIKLRADILGYAAPKKIEHSGETLVGVTPELATLVSEIQEKNLAQRGDLTRVTAGELEPGQILDAEIVDDHDD